jgi:DNA-binding response OmpR family regulator
MSGAIEVLLVEDNYGDVELVQQSFAECELPVNLKVARDGQEALRVLSDPEYSPRLVILDLNLPKVPGLAVLERAPRRGAPFVIFSSSCNTGEIKRALQLGARECIRKPTEMTAFVKAVCSMVERWAGN